MWYSGMTIDMATNSLELRNIKNEKMMGLQVLNWN
jgi:hypothetical protein